MSRQLRVKGHELRSEGQAYNITTNWQGKTGIRYTGAFTGMALCACGSTSELLPSDAARKRWHREHKQAVISTGHAR